jgi:hypothetical protein
MTKKLFAFIDGSEIEAYAKMGFGIERDGEEYVAEMDLSAYDNLAVYAALEDCLLHNDVRLSVTLDYDGLLMFDEEALDFMAEAASKAPLAI